MKRVIDALFLELADNHGIELDANTLENLYAAYVAADRNVFGIKIISCAMKAKMVADDLTSFYELPEFRVVDDEEYNTLLKNTALFREYVETCEDEEIKMLTLHRPLEDHFTDLVAAI